MTRASLRTKVVGPATLSDHGTLDVPMELSFTEPFSWVEATVMFEKSDKPLVLRCRFVFTSKASVRTLKHMDQIKVNGIARDVVNQWSTAPGIAPHTYRIDSAVVYYTMWGWVMQYDGAAPTDCTVERMVQS